MTNQFAFPAVGGPYDGELIGAPGEAPDGAMWAIPYPDGKYVWEANSHDGTIWRWEPEA